MKKTNNKKELNENEIKKISGGLKSDMSIKTITKHYHNFLHLKPPVTTVIVKYGGPSPNSKANEENK